MKYIEEVNPGHYPILIYIILCLKGEDGDVKIIKITEIY